MLLGDDLLVFAALFFALLCRGFGIRSFNKTVNDEL